MSSQTKNIDRRSFLKLMASGALSSLLPAKLFDLRLLDLEWPSLKTSALPWSTQDILNRIPETVLGQDGYLSLVSPETGKAEDVSVFPTKWNYENSSSYNQLKANLPWGIVIHWFGDKSNEQKNIDFYLRGFNGMRQIGEYYTSTSAHFLVGDQAPTTGADATLGIVQTQKPAPDGTPYQAAHIRSLDHNAYETGRHYFMLALNQLSRSYPGIRSILQDFYAVPGVLAHMQTLAIETSGSNFDDPENYPGSQKIANVVSVVWAIMKRYKIPATNLMGHFEIQLSKPDPGKKFLALIKTLIGIKALISSDETMKMLVFGPFLELEGTPRQGVSAYFKYLRDYLLLTTSPRQIYEWDAWSKYFLILDAIRSEKGQPKVCNPYTLPIQGPTWQPGFGYLDPGNHDGVDIYPRGKSFGGSTLPKMVHLVAAGTCLYLGESEGIHAGLLAVFRHRLGDGSELISSYGHLDEIRNIVVGERYLEGQVIGKINTPKSAPNGYLHFSIAYGPSWEITLHKNPNTPLNAGPTWIRNYFMDPADFLAATHPGFENSLENTHFRPK